MTAARESLIDELSRAILALRPVSWLRVAVDGVDGVGKTTFADALGQALSDRGAPVIRASIDGFHNPREIRYRQGRASPAGFYGDSYDLEALRRELLDPLSPGGDGRHRRAVFDHASDRPVEVPVETARQGSVLILDGLFLHRRELARYWDFSIFLDAPFEITIPRGAARGPGWGSPDPAALSNQRYIGGQRLYFETDNPKPLASVVVDNSDFDAPFIVARRP